MDKIWRLQKATFLLVLSAVLLILAYVMFQNSVLAVVCVYGALFLIFLGVAGGLFAIIDHNREQKEAETEE